MHIAKHAATRSLSCVAVNGPAFLWEGILANHNYQVVAVDLEIFELCDVEKGLDTLVELVRAGRKCVSKELRELIFRMDSRG